MSAAFCVGIGRVHAGQQSYGYLRMVGRRLRPFAAVQHWPPATESCYSLNSDGLQR